MAFSWQSILSYVISKHFHSVTGVKIEVGYKKGCIAGWHLISQHGTKSRAAPSYFSANLQGKNPGALRNAQRLLLKDSVAFCVIFDIELMNFLLICNAHLLLALCSAPSSRHAALCRKPSQDLPELQTFWSHLPQKSAFLASGLLISSRCCQIWTRQCSPWQANDAQVCFWDCFSWWILCARSDWGYLKGHSDKECLGKSHPWIPRTSESSFGGSPANPAKMVFKWSCKWKMNIQMEGYFSNYLSGKAQDLEVTCLATPVLGRSPPKETAIWNFQQIAKDFSRAAARKEKPAQTNVVLQSTKAITGAAGCCDHVCCCCLVLAVPRPGLASQWVPPCDDFLLDTIGTIADLSVGAEGSLLPAKTWKADFLNLV